MPVSASPSSSAAAAAARAVSGSLPRCCSPCSLAGPRDFGLAGEATVGCRNGALRCGVLPLSAATMRCCWGGEPSTFRPAEVAAPRWKCLSGVTAAPEAAARSPNVGDAGGECTGDSAGDSMAGRHATARAATSASSSSMLRLLELASGSMWLSDKTRLGCEGSAANAAEPDAEDEADADDDDEADRGDRFDAAAASAASRKGDRTVGVDGATTALPSSAAASADASSAARPDRADGSSSTLASLLVCASACTGSVLPLTLKANGFTAAGAVDAPTSSSGSCDTAALSVSLAYDA